MCVCVWEGGGGGGSQVWGHHEGTIYVYVKSLINDWLITCDEIIDMSETVSIDSINKKVKYKTDFFVFYTILLVNICLLLLIIIVINCYNIKNQLIQNNIHILIIYKVIGSNKIKEKDIKNRTCYYFDDIININDLDLGNIY